MNQPRQERLKTAIAWAVSSVVGVALAAATVGFAGWCLGGSVGSGLQLLGWAEAGDALSTAGAIAGAAAGGLFVLHAMVRGRTDGQDQGSRTGTPEDHRPPCG